ncbi:1,2-phenylacetyl-CoA epoxidase subunit PaaD [Roseicyclus sp. F158]|uniref:1,2-phenylacetyl-CoA epoxidase subunit PaaD n=1 Tax=Tropicimonas omnivorans TaxID=3075590 RepID=A0ABU3DER6_9RHOB|nr:1,2-phenylacetyl-CoA epoxidase subunit PaaD [Roseicyclus sp. F158]MDT0682195.1 1,2-phenylacetyl-CoA epoxidase subunit PaaD [Roseicyclus sp. F158]
MLDTLPSEAEIWDWLSEVEDPEIPVISVVDLGIVREVRWEGETLVVAVTPTYSGCPAVAVINFAIESHLREKGVESIRLERRLSPPWTTQWLSDEGREKLRNYGIAPPIEGTGTPDQRAQRVARLEGRSSLDVACPRCGSLHTERVSQFGSTPCKAAWRCRDCLEPFDYFKCI